MNRQEEFENLLQEFEESVRDGQPEIWHTEADTERILNFRRESRDAVIAAYAAALSAREAPEAWRLSSTRKMNGYELRVY